MKERPAYVTGTPLRRGFSCLPCCKTPVLTMTAPSQICDQVLPNCNLEKEVGQHLQSRQTRLFDDSEIKIPQGKGERAVRFIRGLRHLESRHAEQRFQPDVWQECLIRRVYGDTLAYGTRRIKAVFARDPRGAQQLRLGPRSLVICCHRAPLHEASAALTTIPDRHGRSPTTLRRRSGP